MSDSLLTKIRVAAPCKSEWKWMYCDARVRFCSQCNLNVYNLSAMSKEEAELLILRTEGRLCVRFYRRKDGTILTSNCPVGLRSIRDKFTSAKARIIAALVSFAVYTSVMFGWYSSRQDTDRISVMGELGNDSLQSSTVGVVFMPSETPIRVSEKLMRDRAMLKLIPVSHQSRGSSVHGTAVVRIIVSESGNVDEATCSSGPEEVRELSEEAARGWTFRPTITGGTPVRVESTLTFKFK